MKLLDAVQERFGPTLHLEDDFYWNVQLKAAIAVDTAPALDLGSVVDDAKSVSAFVAPQEEFVSIWHESDDIAGSSAQSPVSI